MSCSLIVLILYRVEIQKRMERITAFHGTPIPMTMKKFNASDHASAKTSLEGSDKKGLGEKAIWLSREGIIIGDNDGEISNLTRTSIELPEISQANGAGMYKDGKYITNVEVS